MTKFSDRYWRVVAFLSGRKSDYQLTFSSPCGRRVFFDLGKFCRAQSTPYHPDEKMTYILIGRQEVIRRIEEHMNLSPEQLARIYDAGALSTPQETAT